MNTATLRLCALTSLAAVLSPAALRASDRTKTDVLHMKNGDRITCEIKSLEHGQLLVKTDYTKGTVTIDWQEVERLESKQLFVVETEYGAYYGGLISTDAKESKNVDVRSETTTTTLRQSKVVGVEQLGRGFIGRMKGAIDYGFSFARSNTQTQSTLSLDLSSRAEDQYAEFAVDSLFSTTGGVETNRHSTYLGYSRRLRASNWSLATFGTGLKSDQQQLDLRTSMGGGVERRFIYTNRNNLVGVAALVYTDERYSETFEGEDRFHSAEAALAIKYSTFRFDSTEWINTLWMYPSLTTSGRFRTSFDSSLYLDLVGDLYFRFGGYFTSDSKPPTNTPKTDYGFTTSVGWSF